MGDVIFSPKALQEYMEWHGEDRKTLDRINILIKDIQRNGLIKGIGKPEALKGIKAYSRRIDDANRLVYSKVWFNTLGLTPAVTAQSINHLVLNQTV